MKALFRYFDGYRRQLVLGPLFKLTEAVLELFVPLLMANIIDVGIKNGNVKYVVTHGLFMLGLGAVGLACALTCQYFAAVCAQGFGRSLRKDLFRHVFSLSQAEYGSVGTNSLITRLTSDVNQRAVPYRRLHCDGLYHQLEDRAGVSAFYTAHRVRAVPRYEPQPA